MGWYHSTAVVTARKISFAAQRCHLGQIVNGTIRGLCGTDSGV